MQGPLFRKAIFLWIGLSKSLPPHSHLLSFPYLETLHLISEIMSDPIISQILTFGRETVIMLAHNPQPNEENQSCWKMTFIEV